MDKWQEVTEKEFSTLFTYVDYQHSSEDGYTDFYKTETPHNEIFMGAIKEIDKVNHYYLLILEDEEQRGYNRAIDEFADKLNPKL